MKSLGAFRLLLAAAMLLLAAPLQAQLKDAGTLPDLEPVPQREIPRTPQREKLPYYLRWLVQPTTRGMLLRLPVIDTDPNRGITGGLMPVWVLREEHGERIKEIYAPSLTYNRHFGPDITYRYYLYPEEDSSLVLRGDLSKFEHEVFVQFEDATFLDKDIDFAAHGQYNVDAGQRYFGTGPNTPKSNETNYKESYIEYRVMAGVPLAPKSPWRAHLSDKFTSDKISDGPLPGLPSFSQTFPKAVYSGRRQIHTVRLILDYDTRDNPVTTSRGAYVQGFAGFSAGNLGSEKDFTRYGLDARYMHPWNKSKTQTTAIQLKFDQMMGNAPFWLQSRLGGKYSLRAYGDGRYTERGLLAANVEERITMAKTKMANVSTEFELAPFAGMGTVFHEPERMASRYARPVVGSAFRAIARPQVVGSVDIGVGQEGVAVFMDINYSF